MKKGLFWLLAVVGASLMLESCIDLTGERQTRQAPDEFWTLPIQQRMKVIIVPEINFRQASAPDVLNYLVGVRTRPPTNHVPCCVGRIETDAPKSYVLQLEDGTPLELPTLTLNYRNISMLDAVSRIAEQLGITFRFEHDKLVPFTKDGRRIIIRESVEQPGPPVTPR